VAQKRGRWIINVVLVLALLAFVGFSVLPLLGSILGEDRSLAVATTTPNSAADQQEKLRDQAKGYELVLQREPDNRTALQGLYEARLKLGDLQGAIAPLEKFAQLNPEQTEYAVLLAQAKQYLGDREGAAVAYRTVLKLKPGDLNALQGLAALLQDQKLPEAAIGLLQDTLKTATQVNQTQPGSIDVPAVQLLLGQVYVSQQRYQEAIAVYDETIKANKQDFRPVLAKALVFQQLKKDSEAKPLFLSAVALAPAKYQDQIKKMAAAKPAPAPSSSPGITPSSPAAAPSNKTAAPAAK